MAGRSSRPRPVKPQQVFMLILCSPPAAPPVGALQLHKPTPPLTPLFLVFLHHLLLHIFSLLLSFLLFSVCHHSSPAIAFTSSFLLLVLHLLTVHLFSFISILCFFSFFSPSTILPSLLLLLLLNKRNRGSLKQLINNVLLSLVINLQLLSALRSFILIFSLFIVRTQLCGVGSLSALS